MAPELRTGIVSLLSALIGGAVVATPTYLSSNRQMDVKMVEIAVGILSQKPETNIEPARSWAVDVIQHYAQVELTPDVKKALIENRALAYTVSWGNHLGYYGTGDDLGYYGTSGASARGRNGPAAPDKNNPSPKTSP